MHYKYWLGVLMFCFVFPLNLIMVYGIGISTVLKAGTERDGSMTCLRGSELETDSPVQIKSHEIPLLTC